MTPYLAGRINFLTKFADRCEIAAARHWRLFEEVGDRQPWRATVAAVLDSHVKQCRDEIASLTPVVVDEPISAMIEPFEMGPQLGLL